ncbi:hypothetical protein [Aquibacillus albus]|uniref:RNase H-like nuclease (RuvC/YqgF family) n=1 Tax=Aquibacillus albus TaxID=1168171 RepID=A0ABS2N4X2_9BACI|nr:hypothetical protein [Aquibacillus albus]MBM7573139.1 putative RNase H-like nuclease (RuvC/YqgF family) [Aquibacillus albus]
MKVTCKEGCQKEFEIKELKKEDIKVSGQNIERYYIECPECKKEYKSFYMNDDIKSIQKQIRTLKNKYPLKEKQKKKLAKLNRKIEYLSKQLKKEIEE